LSLPYTIRPKGKQAVIVFTFADIDASWQRMDQLDIEDAPSLIDKIGKEQPFMLTYLMATGSDILNQHERKTLLFMSVMIWYIVSENIIQSPKMPLALFEEKEAINISMLEYLAGESETDFMDTVEKIMTNYHQAELLRYVIENLLEQAENQEELSEENIGMIVIYLKTIIDCLDMTI
jgi:hypothetical protein